MKTEQKNTAHTRNDKYARGNFICNVILVFAAIISCSTYIAGNLISLYNFYETKDQNKINNSSDIFVSDIIYYGSIISGIQDKDSIFSHEHKNYINFNGTSAPVKNNFHIYNTGNSTAKKVTAYFYINNTILEYIKNFIRINKVDMQFFYNTLQHINFNGENKDIYSISVGQRTKDGYASETVIENSVTIPIMKKDVEKEEILPLNFDTIIKLIAFFKYFYKEKFDLNFVNKNPILILIKWYDGHNNQTYQTTKVQIGDLLFGVKDNNIFYLVNIATSM